MKKTVLILFVLNLFFAKNYGQNPLRTDGTAFTAKIKTLELSLFRPAKYGISKKDEISLHPVGVFVLPHLFYKRRWVRFDLFGRHFMFSSRHGLYYPKPVLNFNQRLSFSPVSYVPENINVPGRLAFQNEVLVSHFLHEPDHCSAGDYLLTAKLGTKYSLGSENDEHPLIYRSVLYRETQVLIPGLIWYAGMQLDGHINFTFNYFADIKYYAYGFVNNYSIESKLGIYGYSGRHLSGFAGLKFAYSVISGGNKFLLMPIAGFSYFIDFRKRRKSGTDLFGRKKPFKHDNSLERDDKYYEELEKRENLKDSVQ